MEFVFENDNNDIKINKRGGSKLPSEVPDFTAPVKPSISSKRRSVATNFSDIEFSEPKKSRRRAAKPKVNYVKSVKKKKRLKAKSKFEWTWVKVGWLVCACLLLRLTFMDRGVIDFYSMENTLQTKTQDLEDIRLDNINLISEIKKIKNSPRYQKKLAREHLGVIAKDEYLILFARDTRHHSI